MRELFKHKPNRQIAFYHIQRGRKLLCLQRYFRFNGGAFKPILYRFRLEEGIGEEQERILREGICVYGFVFGKRGALACAAHDLEGAYFLSGNIIAKGRVMWDQNGIEKSVVQEIEQLVSALFGNTEIDLLVDE